VATALFRELGRLARNRRIRRAFVLASESNEPAMRLYESVGGVRPFDDDVMWRFEYADD
jgi:ribosomal protein S18 acetylase RimI-like enzyme